MVKEDTLPKLLRRNYEKYGDKKITSDAKFIIAKDKEQVDKLLSLKE